MSAINVKCKHQIQASTMNVKHQGHIRIAAVNVKYTWQLQTSNIHVLLPLLATTGSSSLAKMLQ